MKNQRNFLSTGKTVLSSALVAASLFACSKKDAQQPASPDAANTVASATYSSPNLYVEETMEGSSPFTSFGGGIENCATDWTYSFPTNPAFQGNKSVRFEIRKDQPLVGSAERVRSEVTVIRGSEWSGFTKNAWYSFAIYFPTVGFESDDTRDCINQWFEDGSDETTIRAQSDKAFLEVTPASGSSSLKKYDLFTPSLGTAGSVATDGPSTFQKISKDKWHEFVFHIKHSTGSDGLIEVWRDGVKIHNITGRNMHTKVPKWKIGLYKSSFLHNTSEHGSRVLYFDNIRVGSAKATFADMTSGKVAPTVPPTVPTTPTKPTTPVTPEEPVATPTAPTTPTLPTAPTAPATGAQRVVSYTLVNSETNKDIMTIANGASISLKAIKATKLNVRANLANGTAAVVKMNLSGADSKERFDDKLPYALFGDESGDYNNWTAKTGKFTLKATPYAGTKSKVGAAIGSEYSISFTIVK
jgi:hypothetical protein